MTKRYTAADFANAKFAEHERGEFAARICADDCDTPWASSSDEYFTDAEMVLDGWVPVSTKPQMTESEYERVLAGVNEDYATGYIDAVNTFGIEVIPDPEPTNTERLEEILKEVWTPIESARTFAEWLDSNGVTAPNVKGN